MRIEIDLSEKQVAAIGTFADEFRLTMPEAVMALAIMAMSTSFCEEDSRELAREAMEAVDDGDWKSCKMDGVFDWLEVQDGPFRAFRRTSTLQAAAASEGGVS